MKIRNVKLLLLMGVLLLTIIILFNLVTYNSSNMITSKSPDKFLSIKDVKVAKILERHLGPSQFSYFYFDLTKDDQKETVTNLLKWLNESSNSMKKTGKREIGGYGGYTPTVLILEFINGITYYICTDSSNLIVNGYYKDSSLLIEKCPRIVQFIDTDWERIKLNMIKNIG
ncbi:hypothetical protein CSC2_35080 [Clostridium zeae]|uniref:Uncharacterized protein n=1 Tax=Clostridium zeae TaxID=2759022 RepID=A0ABQ1EDX2_9CLOT|nr:hypothetical protein [Clostridium zeae]GFZ32982.1 hypothetical protein CSC2_35080 [Clostridium zeae]